MILSRPRTVPEKAVDRAPGTELPTYDVLTIAAEVVAEEERKGERLANQLSLGLCAIVALVLVINVLGGSIGGDQGVIGGALVIVYGSIIGGTLLLIRAGQYRPGMKYVTALATVFAISGYLLYSTFRIPTTPFMASIPWLYFAAIALAGLRHSVLLVFVVGIATVASFSVIGLISLGLIALDPLPARIAQHATSVTLLSRLVYFLGTTALLMYAARTSRQMLVRSATAQAERMRAVAELNLQLEERVRSYIQELQSAAAQQGRMVERLRIAREMHDGIAASLQGLALQAEVVVELLRQGSSRALEHAELVSEVSGALRAEIREIIGDLRGLAADEPFAAQLRRLVEEVAARFGTSVAIQIDEPLPDVDPQVRHEILRIVEEALQNAHRHAGECQIAVRVRRSGDLIEVTVSDDGNGFREVDEATLVERGHYGLIGMRERADQIGATLEIRTAPGAGTSVIIRLRVHAAGMPSVRLSHGTDGA